MLLRRLIITFEVITNPQFKHVKVKYALVVWSIKSAVQPVLQRRLIINFEVITYPQFKYIKVKWSLVVKSIKSAYQPALPHRMISTKGGSRKFRQCGSLQRFVTYFTVLMRAIRPIASRGVSIPVFLKTPNSNLLFSRGGGGSGHPVPRPLDPPEVCCLEISYI